MERIFCEEAFLLICNLVFLYQSLKRSVFGTAHGKKSIKELIFSNAGGYSFEYNFTTLGIHTDICETFTKC